MRILHLAYADSSGVPSRWAQAHEDAGHAVSVLFETAHPYGYPTAAKVTRWTPGSSSAAERADRIRGYLDWADAVMAYDHPFYLDAAIAAGKPVLFRALGSSSREQADLIGSLLESSLVARATTGLVDIAERLEMPLVGAPYPLLAPAEPAGFVACHAPSDREMKRTGVVLREAAAAGWTVDLVERASNREVLRRKRRAGLVIDCAPRAIPDGYGVNSVEAMALGLPALAGASERTRAIMRQAGSPVVLAGSRAEFNKSLRDLRDPEMRRDLGAQGRAFVASFHSATARAMEDMAAVERLLKVAA